MNLIITINLVLAILNLIIFVFNLKHNNKKVALFNAIVFTGLVSIIILKVYF